MVSYHKNNPKDLTRFEKVHTIILKSSVEASQTVAEEIATLINFLICSLLSIATVSSVKDY